MGACPRSTSAFTHRVSELAREAGDYPVVNLFVAKGKDHTIRLPRFIASKPIRDYPIWVRPKTGHVISH